MTPDRDDVSSATKDLLATRVGRARVATAVAAFGVTTAVVALLAYFLIFSYFAEYDDEGYLLISLRSFRQGQALYDTVFSQYGPFYYAFMDGLRSVLRLEWTHDAGRFITLGIWTSTSPLSGLLIFALTPPLPPPPLLP